MSDILYITYWMKSVKLTAPLLAIPVVFLVLVGSANLVGWRIGLTLAFVAILYLVVTYLSNSNWHNPTWQGRLLSGIMSGLVIGMAIMGKSVNWQFSTLIILWPLVMMLRSERLLFHILLRIIQGVILFMLVYIGVNQYGFNSVLHSHVLLLMLVFICQFIFLVELFDESQNFKNGVNIWILIVTYGMTVLSLGLYGWYRFSLTYALMDLVLTLPVFVLFYRNYPVFWKSSSEPDRRFIGRLRIIALASLSVFQVYLFIDSYHVLQAVMAGY